MAPKFMRSREDHRGSWPKVLMAVLPLVAIGLLLMPQSLTDRIRLRASPVFSPLQDRTEDWTLDLAGRLRGSGSSASDGDEADLRRQVTTYQNALAEMAAMLDESDRRVRDLARIRAGLENLPCRLTPARLVAPEVAGGQAAARLGEGADKGLRKFGAVIARRRMDRGTREAIEHGNPILTAAGLVGVVDEVGPTTSTVRLVTDPRLSLMVQVISNRDGKWRAGPQGVARGSDDGASVTVQGIPRGAEVEPGDFVVTSPSPESPLPPYLVVGRVTQCEIKPAALFRSLVVEPRVPLAEAREVYVMSPEAASPAGAAGRLPSKP
jgi:hypothetical protein